jgi:Holliday junction resolvase
MVQKPIDSWQNKTTVKKGNTGEKIVKEYLEREGYVVYRPETSGSHPFDNLCASDNNIFVAEVKTKEARKYYPDTGIDIRHFNKYMNIKSNHNMAVYLFFVDASNAKVYGNELGNLIKQITVNGKNYPLRHKGIIYFPLENMVTIYHLTKQDCESINRYNTKKYQGAWNV